MRTKRGARALCATAWRSRHCPASRNGWHFLGAATPFLATESMMSHLLLEKNLQSHIQMKYFEAGHMMYVHEPSLKKIKEAIAEFYDDTGSHP